MFFCLHKSYQLPFRPIGCMNLLFWRNVVELGDRSPMCNLSYLFFLPAKSLIFQSLGNRSIYGLQPVAFTMDIRYAQIRVKAQFFSKL